MSEPPKSVFCLRLCQHLRSPGEACQGRQFASSPDTCLLSPVTCPLSPGHQRIDRADARASEGLSAIIRDGNPAAIPATADLTIVGLLPHALVMSDRYAEAEIPDEFWSAYSEQPFDVCIDCAIPLTDGVPYAIQKHFVAGEAVFEMAICLACAARLQEGFSAESREALQQAILAAPERTRRQQEADDEESLQATSVDEIPAMVEEFEHRQRVRLERAMAACALCGTPRSECHRYSLGTACLGEALINAAPDLENLGSPFLICEECERQLNECLSQKTRDAWDRFVEETFDGPPALSVDPQELVAIF